jgi:uncharacterized protein
MATRPIADGLWTDADPPALIGGRQLATGRIVFPCPVAADGFEPVVLARTGRVWSYTIQRFPPKSPPYAGPEPFEPFALAYVELPGEVIVEARLVDVGFDELRTGLPVELAVVPFRTDPDGTTVTTYAFRPSDRGAP